MVTNLNTLNIYDKQEMRHSFHFRNIIKLGPSRPDFGPARPVTGWQISGPGLARGSPARPLLY
jgi:hypothetical protein